MEEAATIEKRDQPKSTEDKNKEDKEEKDSQGKDEVTVRTPGAQTEQNEPSESVVNTIGNSDTVNQAGDQTVKNTVKYVETNQGAIDQEKEQCGPINANRNTSQGAGNVTLNIDNEPQMEEGAVGAHTNVTLKQNEQPDKEGDIENIVLPEEVECDSPAEVSAQVVDKELQPDVIKNETPEGEKRWSSQETTKGERTKGLPLAVSDEKSPKEDFEKTEAASSEVTIPATPSPFNKEPSKERENGNTTTTEKESLDHPEQQENEEEGPVSPEPSEIVKTAPAVTSEVDEQQQQQQQPGDQDEEMVGETEKDIPPEGSQSRTTWYSGDKQAPQQEAEGYSTSVVAGVVMRKPLSSTSNESKTPARGSSTGSVFKKMSWGSLFGRRRSTKDKPNMAQQAATETPVHDGTVGVQEDSPGHLDPKEDSTPADATVKDISQDAGQPSEEAVVTSKPQGNEEVSAEVEQEEKDIAEGAIVPLEEGVNETLEQDEHNDDIETPDEDSLLRERIAKRESGTPSHSPTKHMQMRMSYAEGTKEVEVIGTLEAPAQHKQDKQKTAKDNRVSCRELGEVDHEGWLAKRGGGAIFSSWKRKWVVLKEQHVYYYKTSFDPEAGGVIDVKDHTITALPEMKKKFCFKIESEDPKATKLYFAADSHEKMNRWISVLTSASRGEIIVRSTQNQESSDVRMRKKTNSMGKRAGSVLGLGGYYSYDGQLEKTDQNRRASFGSSPKEAPKNIQPGDDPENNDHSESSTENATPNDIQKLLITETKGDSVDAAVAMETTAPLKEEVEANVVLADNSEEQKQAPVEVEAKISSETTKEECLLQATSPDREKTITVPKVCHSETKDSSALPKDTHVATPPEKNLKPSHPTGPSNTTWYYVLDDDHDNWIDLDELKDEALKRDSDELLSLVRTIKDARLSMIGTPLPGNEERVRAITNVSKQNEEVLRLREMKRTLKDKQRDLMAMEELLTKDVNRQSIHEWKTRYSYLTPEEDPIEEGESKENGFDEKENESRSLRMPDGKEGDGGVKDTSVGEEKVGDSADEQEIKLEECGHQENRKNMSEHEEVNSDKEVQDKLEEVEVKEDGELQNDGGESQFEEDGCGEDSPKNSKVEDSGDEPTHAKDDANDVMLVKEDTHQKMEATKHDVDGDLADQTVQEETTEQNNNGDMNTWNLPDQQGNPSGNNDKEGKKSIDTPQTLTQQDQDSIDTRL